MLSFRFKITVPIDAKTLAYIEATTRAPLTERGAGWARPCEAAGKVEVLNALPKLRAAVPKGEASLDVFTWDVILGELARYNLGPAKGDDDLLWTFWAIRQAMHADERYQALLKHARQHEKNERRVARAKKRYERDRQVVHAYTATGSPTRALESVRKLT